jgi:hypothetical protein
VGLGGVCVGGVVCGVGVGGCGWSGVWVVCVVWWGVWWSGVEWGGWVGCVVVWCECVVWGRGGLSLRSNRGLHSVRLWTPTIFNFFFFGKLSEKQLSEPIMNEKTTLQGSKNIIKNMVS